MRLKFTAGELMGLAHQWNPRATEAICRDLWVIDNGGERRLSTDRVIWIQAERDYIRLHTAERSFLVRETLHAICERLRPMGFIQIHRGVVVNDNKVVRRIRHKSGALRLIVEGGAELPVGRKFRSERACNGLVLQQA
jgi:DNA-binding LytR/AlgR family response regulator